jgi:tetratricopeptide (TPR) repeat protein
MMNKKFAFSLAVVLAALLLFGCQSKELRTTKIELGTWSKPKPNPNLDRVKQNLEQAEQQSPDNPEIYHLWGRVYAMENNYQEMANAFTKCNDLTDQFKAINDTISMMEWDTLFNKAVEAYKNENFEATLGNLKNAIIAWPYQFEPYLYGADAAYRMGDIEEAYNMSKSGYELVPDSIRMARQYAEMCLMAEKLDEAEPVFIRLSELDPSNSSYLFSRGEIYMSRGDTTKAIEFYEQGLNLDPDNPEAYLSISKLYFLIKDYSNSVNSFEKYKAMAENINKDDYFLYLLSVYQANDFEKSKVELEKFTMDHPDECDAWQLLANTYLHLKMKNEAQKANDEYDKCAGK